MASLTPMSRTSSKRRTNRLAMTMNIGVRGQDRRGTNFTVAAKATNLNRHGGTISIAKELTIGTMLELRNSKQAEAMARVVRQVSEYAGTRSYGIEFVAEASGFWGIFFPGTAAAPKDDRRERA